MKCLMCELQASFARAIEGEPIELDVLEDTTGEFEGTEVEGNTEEVEAFNDDGVSCIILVVD